MARNDFTWPAIWPGTGRPPEHPVADNPLYKRILKDVATRTRVQRSLALLESQHGEGSPEECERRRLLIASLRRWLQRHVPANPPAPRHTKKR